MEINKDSAGNLIYLKDNNGKALLVTGTTVPADAWTVYAKGCMFIDTDVASGTGSMYLNKWTSASCIFTLVTQAA